MPTEPKLLPCPFCGAKAQLKPIGNLVRVSCRNVDCLVVASTPDYAQSSDAIRIWNTRAPSQSPEAPAEWMRKAAYDFAMADCSTTDANIEKHIQWGIEIIAKHAPACDADKPAWRTMEDAPRDGTKVLLYWPFWRGFPVIGWFIAGAWDSDYCVLAVDGEPPIAWQPLPAPPAAAKEGE